MPKLVVSLPDAGEVIHELTESTISVGRVEDNLIQILDGSVSSHHAELNAEGDTYILSDLGSTNGTHVNGVPLLDPVLLTPGDRITFGSIDAIFEPVAGAPAMVEETEFASAAPAMMTEGFGRPEGFQNASPFSRKKAKGNPAAVVAVLLFVLALVAAGAAGYVVYSMEIPQF